MKEKLLELHKNSYAPYSNYHFACIVETKNGNLYEGVNVENASFGATVCAERNAILNYLGNRNDFQGARIYVDLFPCNECAKAIVQAGIKEIIYMDDKYKDTDSIKVSKNILDTCSVKYRKYEQKNKKIEN